jgi:hypothetical protein
VAQFRRAEFAPLQTVLKGYAEIAETRLPTNFSIVLEQLVSFVDPLIAGGNAQGIWNPVQGKWI